MSGANLTNLPAGGISNVVEDTSPQLGGNLDVLTREITTSTTNGDIVFTPDGTGIVKIKGAGSTDGTPPIKLLGTITWCEAKITCS